MQSYNTALHNCKKYQAERSNRRVKHTHRYVRAITSTILD